MENSIKYVNIEDLLPGQIQAHFENIGDNIDNLANSIKKYGIIVPLIVREKGINQYEIILGNRRYSAARAIGLKEIPVIVQNVDDEKALDIVISDNIQRRELTAKEEAYLYEKDIEYVNNNEQELSNKLGIPVDRIISKLNFGKNTTESSVVKPINNNLSNPIDNISMNSSINQDIISLTELNKEEREDYNMNNEIINNQNLNTDPTATPQQTQTQEPTFGGRFFPSLEDAPTNMNMNSNISPISTPQTQPLIDLTDQNPSTTQNEVQESNINEQNNIPSNVNTPINNDINNNINNNINDIPNYNNDINQNINSNDIQQEQPNVPNLDALSTNIVDNNQVMSQNLNTNIDSQPINIDSSEPMSTTQYNNTSINNNQITEEPSITNNIPTQDIEQPTQVPDANSIINEQVVTDNIPQPMNQEIPTEPTNIINNNVVDNTATIDIPTNNIQESSPNVDNSINQVNNDLPPVNGININTQKETKDIIPVINMLKSLAVNIENLGYKLNINESENDNTYSINIEVEK